MIDQKVAVELLTALLQDNINNKLSVSLANGIIQMFSGELNRSAEIQELAANATIVKE